MVFKIILSFVLILYSILSLFAFLSNDKIKTSEFKVAICVISCFLIFISSAGILLYKVFFVWTLVAGIILLQIIALINGFLLHARPNWLHHFMRLIFSIFIIWFYMKYA